PAKLCSTRPSFLASASAPSFILAKNGLVLVLVMRPTMTVSAAPAEPVHRTAVNAVTTTHAVTLFKRDASDCPRAAARVSTIMSRPPNVVLAASGGPVFSAHASASPPRIQIPHFACCQADHPRDMHGDMQKSP